VKPTIVVRRRFEGPAFVRLAERYAVTVLDDELRPAALAGHLRAAGAIWTVGEVIDDAFLDAVPDLRVIGNQGTGYNTIDVDAVERRGVVLVIPRGINADAVATHAIGLLVALRHRLPEGDAFVRSGAWGRRMDGEPVGEDVAGSTIGIVGMGAIGSEVARRARAFRMRVLYANRSPRPAIEAELGATRVDLDALLGAADHVVVCCPLTPATTGLIGARELALMRPTAILLNVARGAVVDEPALVRALTDGRLLGAGLDVFAAEPVVPAALLDHPRVIVTPHVADLQTGVMEALTAAVVEGLLAAPLDRTSAA
jgi:lactate dehydrogenase-like 2-hydroxyacid dehydrogenase